MELQPRVLVHLHPLLHRQVKLKVQLIRLLQVQPTLLRNPLPASRLFFPRNRLLQVQVILPRNRLQRTRPNLLRFRLLEAQARVQVAAQANLLRVHLVGARAGAQANLLRVDLVEAKV